MKYEEQHIPIGDLNAETWLNAMFLSDKPFWVRKKGIFYRNYCEDVLELSLSEIVGNQIVLSRDGLFHILPEGLFFQENACREARKEGKSLEPYKEHIANIFSPIDTEFFNVTRGLELSTHEMERDKIDILLNLLYDGELEGVDTPLVRKLTPFLLHAPEIRGNFALIRSLMKAITGFQTAIRPESRTVLLHSGVQLEYPCVSIEFHIPNLSNSDYSSQYEKLGKFVEFIAEWFFPAELDFEFQIKDENQQFVLDDEILTLDYNTYL